MKTWLSILMIMIASLSFAQEDYVPENELTWEDFWVTGTYYCYDKKYEDGAANFSEAITRLELANDPSHPQILVDRGQAYSLLCDFDFAIFDFDTALANPVLSIYDQVRAHTGLISNFSAMGREEEVLIELDALKAIDPNFPQVEISKYYIVIRNLPDNKWYRNAVKCLLIHSGMVESKEDMFIYPSNILVAVRQCHCGCEGCEIRESKEQYCDQCGQLLQFSPSTQSPSEDQLITYQQNCRELTISSTAWCMKMLKKPSSRLAGLYAVDLIAVINDEMAPDDYVFERCIPPFANLINTPEALLPEVWY